MTSARPGPVAQRFEAKFSVRRGHPLRVVHMGAEGPVATHGVYAKVSREGWLTLRHSDGPNKIMIDRIETAEEID